MLSRLMPPKLVALIIKELLSAFRDPRTRMAFIIPPLIQVFLYSYAATLEVTNVPIAVYNEDWGQASRQLVTASSGRPPSPKSCSCKIDDEMQPAIDAQRVLAACISGRISRGSVAAKSPRPCR